MAAIEQHFQQATFLNSAAQAKQFPPDHGVEIAFAGRSNAGKSSAINTLCRRKRLAFTSKTPGRTQLLNFFRLHEHARFVDLPGYGYAKAPEPVKNQWRNTLTHYFEQRTSLYGVVLLMDIRHPLQTLDHTLLDWALGYQKQVHILLTKADKLKHGAAKHALMQTQKQLNALDIKHTLQLFSAPKRQGLTEFYHIMTQWLTAPHRHA